VSEFIAEILEIYLEIKYWIKHKKRRKYEKENNLPKSIVWHPITKPLLIFFPIFFICVFLFSLFNLKNKSEEKTKFKIDEIVLLLEAENKQFGYYPKKLKTIIRNNPLRKNIILDGWKNNFIYTISKDSLHYKLISLGKDSKLNTFDDIKVTN